MKRRKPQAREVERVALFDLNRTADPDYLVRCGVDLDALLVVRPSLQPQAVDLLGDLVRHPLAGGPLAGRAALRYAYERATYEALLAMRLLRGDRA